MPRHGAAAQALLSSPVRRDIHLILSNLPLTPSDPSQGSRRSGLTASALGERLNLHVTTIRFHVDQMLAAGLLVAQDVRGGVGRPSRRYAVHPSQVEGSEPNDHRIAAEILADAWALGHGPHDEPAVVVAARDWAGRHLPAPWSAAPPGGASDDEPETLALIADALDRWGFAPCPRRTPWGAEIELTACPFADLAARYPELTTLLVRGLVSGVLTALDSALVPQVAASGPPGQATIHLAKPDVELDRPGGPRPAYPGVEVNSA